MAKTRLGQVPVGVQPYGAFQPKDPAPSSGPHNPGVITRLAQFGVGLTRYGVFQPKTTAAPTATTPSGGGTSRRGRTLPQYYSRRFFEKEIQLPQEVEANRVAQEVLEQAAGVLEDLHDGAEYDALLRTTEQLLRIVAVQIESRAIYNVVEQVRNKVLAKKDAEIREYIAAADEENEVVELMEFL